LIDPDYIAAFGLRRLALRVAVEYRMRQFDGSLCQPQRCCAKSFVDR
jgi:hypothetical protein